mgnify:FL=1|jgi:hypothetical protein
MHLITSFPKYHDGEINRALMRELTTGLEFKKEIERSKEAQAAEQAKELVNQREVPGLGRCIGVIPEWEFFRMQQKYGAKEVHSKEFMKYYQKKFPHLSPNKI